MRAFKDHSPIVTAVYYLSAISLLMLFPHPVLPLFAFLGALLYSFFEERRPSPLLHLGFLSVFLLLTAVNPIFSHNGRTVLFVINDAPITLEAILFGVVSAGGLVSALYLFRSFTVIMTRDKLLYVFGALSPKLALVLSMGLRYVPLFRERARRIADSQKALGLYKEDNILDKAKGDLRVFSILVTWALENGVTTADSMEARGYGRRRRTHFSPFRFRRGDVCLLLLILSFTALCAVGGGMGALSTVFYPTFFVAAPTPLGVGAIAAYGLLSFTPVILEVKERVKWRCLRSRI